MIKSIAKFWNTHKVISIVIIHIITLGIAFAMSIATGGLTILVYVMIWGVLVDTDKREKRKNRRYE